MLSLPGFFLALAGTTLLGALALLWSSLRAAFGGGPRLVLDTVRDLPDHAALLEEKRSLLRAIKDLEYERAVGKIGDQDFARLDAAYRARAKEVLALLDRDVQPLFADAERLIQEKLGAAAERPKKKKVKRSEQPAREPTPEERAKAELAEIARRMPVLSRNDAAMKRSIEEAVARSDAAAPEPEHELERAAEEVVAASTTKTVSLDDVVAGIRDGSIAEAPEAPADWPDDARKFFRDAVKRELDARAKPAAKAEERADADEKAKADADEKAKADAAEKADAEEKA